MPLQIHMKMDGVSGAAASFKHKGWIEVLSWNWGMTSNRREVHNQKEQKTVLNELSVVKTVTYDSPGLRLLYAEGKPIGNVEISIIPQVGKREAPAKYVHIRMQDVLIKSIVTGGSAEDNLFKEHITLIFDRISFVCSKAATTGDNAEATEDFDFAWDVAKNSVWKR